MEKCIECGKEGYTEKERCYSCYADYLIDNDKHGLIWIYLQENDLTHISVHDVCTIDMQKDWFISWLKKLFKIRKRVLEKI